MGDRNHTPSHPVREIFSHGFILVFLSFFLFVAANHALIPTFPIFLSGEGCNEREIGILVGLFAVSALASRLFVGRALAWCSEKSVMMVGALLSALTFLACLVFRPFWPIFVVRVFQGAAFAFMHTAAIAYTLRVVPPERRGQGIAYFMVAPNLAMAMAAPFGMFLINRFSFNVFFLFGSALCLCACLLPLDLRKPEKREPVESSPGQGNAFLEPKIIVPAIVSLLQSFVFGAVAAFFPLYAIECGVTNPGLFFSANAIMVVASRLLGGGVLDAYDRERTIPVFIVLSLVAMVILAFSRSLSLFIFVGALWGVAGGFFYPTSMAYSFGYAGRSDGTAVGTYSAFMDLGIALGPLVMGLILPVTGYLGMFLSLAFVCLLNFCYFQFYVVRRGRRAVTVA